MLQLINGFAVFQLHSLQNRRKIQAYDNTVKEKVPGGSYFGTGHITVWALLLLQLGIGVLYAYLSIYCMYIYIYIVYTLITHSQLLKKKKNYHLKHVQ